MTEDGALYAGVVRHHRLRPREHKLSYRIFMLLLDLDQLDATFARLGLLRRGRFGLTSFEPADYGDRSGRPLKAQVEETLSAAGVPTGGPIRLLTMPRVLGHGFNPLSVYFCHARDGTLAAILYEVSNTFGERHSYLIATPQNGAGGDEPLVRQVAPKRFHVSPFMDLDLTYEFLVNPPGAACSIAILVRDEDGLMFSASFAGKRQTLTDAVLLRAWLAHPLLTLKVVAGIHWEALKIWRKGVRYRPKPPPPAESVTVGETFR
jgi:DUF1365 family protein